MFETSTTPRIREGIERAHQERAEVLRNAIRWFTRRH